MKFVDYSSIPDEEWDSFCKTSDTAWFFHTSTRLNYIEHLDINNHNRSFAIYDNNKILSIVPLIEVDLETPPYRGFSYGRGTNIPYPAFLNDISKKRREKLIKVIFKKILNIKNVAYVIFFVIPLLDEILSKKTIVNPLVKFGFNDTTLTTNILNLEIPEKEIFGQLRSNAKRELKHAEKERYKVEIVDKENYDDTKFQAYRNIHFRASGKQTRPDETWIIMQDWIKNGLAVLSLVKKNKNITAAFFIDTYKQKAYFHSAATLPEYQRESGIGHLMHWEVIKYLKSKGFTHYEMGWNWYNNISQEVADKKMTNISWFKRSFGETVYPLFRGEYFHNKSYMEKVYLERLNRYFDIRESNCF